MTTPLPAKTRGDLREDTAATVAAAVAAVYQAVEVAILTTAAELLRRVAAGRMTPQAAARKVAHAVDMVMAAARPRVADEIHDGLTLVATDIRALLAGDTAHLPAPTADAVTTSVIPFPSPPAPSPAASLAGSLVNAEQTAKISAQAAFTDAAAQLPAPQPGPAGGGLPPRKPPLVNPYRGADDAYSRAVQSAIEDTRGGMPYSSLSLSRVQAAQKALDQLADQGITGFVDSRGRRWNLASYVEMATRTAVSAAWDNLQAGALSRAGLDLVKVATRSTEGSCPHCLPWLGRILSLTGATEGYRTVDEARATGFRHPNCRCFWYPYGAPIAVDLSNPVPDDQAAAAYEASQRQRGLERRVRAAGRRRAVAVTPAARRSADRDWKAARLASDAHRRSAGLRMTAASVRRREDPFRAF